MLKHPVTAVEEKSQSWKVLKPARSVEIIQLENYSKIFRNAHENLDVLK